MSKEEISKIIEKCDTYIENLNKFMQALEIVGDLSDLSSESLEEWKKQLIAACPDSIPLIEAMLSLVPEVM